MIINKKFFAEYSPIGKNYDYSEIMLYVPVATEIWLRPILGDKLLNEIEEQIKTNTVSDANATLLTTGNVWQYLCYATCYEGLPFLWTNISEVGITLGHSDNSDSVSLKDMTYIQQHLRNQVEFLKDSVKRFICEHYMSFPLADVCGCGCSCCQDNNAKLNKPNPQAQIYSTNRKCTNMM